METNSNRWCILSDPTIFLLEEIIHKAKQYGADAADAVYIHAQSQSIEVREQKLESTQRAEHATLGFRVLCGKKQASCSISDTGSLDVDAIAKDLVAQAKILPNDPFAHIAEQTGTHLQNTLELHDATNITPQTMQEIALDMEAIALKHAGIKKSLGAAVGHVQAQAYLANSYGFMGSYESSNFSKSVSVLAGEGEEMVRDYAYDTKIRLEDLKDNQSIGTEAALRTLRQYKPIIPPTGEAQIVFDPRIARSFLGQLVSAINGSSITQKSSFLIDKMNMQILPENFSLIDDPLLKGHRGSRPFDDEGYLSRKNTFIKDGILQGWILDTRSALELDLQSTASASRSPSSLPYPSSSNIYLHGGSTPLKDFMRQYAGGIYITSTMGMGVNLLTGDYSQGATGLMINADGSLGKAVHNFTIAGNLSNMLMQLHAADDLDMSFTTAAPTLSVGSMMVAGDR